MPSRAKSAPLTLASLLALGFARAGLAYEVRVDPRLGPLFAESVREAARLIEAPGCAALLHEMTDTRTGATLSASLGTTGLSPSDFLTSLLYRSGAGMPPCVDRKTAAFTSPGNRVVFVCPGAFRGNRAPRGIPARVVVLHEALHALGLGEDPPTSWEITVRVTRRCSR